MATVGETTRPGYVYDSATDVWIPIGIGPHSHTPAAIGAISSSVVTTKGDLIVATGSGTVVRQGVGADGSYLVADSRQADGVTWAGPSNMAGRNAVLNSNFSVWQRGTSISVGATFPYTADRWQAVRAGVVAGMTVSRQATGDTTNLPNIQYCARLQRDSGNTSTASLSIFNAFESVNSIPLAGKAVTLSFYARAGANYSGGGLSAILQTGTGTDQNPITSVYTGSAFPIAPTATLTTTWQRFSATATLSSSLTEMNIYFSWTPTGTAGANDYVEVTGVQLEVGSVATPYAPNGATYQAELAACQRYYFRTSGGVSQATHGLGIATSTTNIRFPINLPVTMRANATSVDYSTLGWSDGVTGASLSLVTRVSGTTTPNVCTVDGTTTGATQYRTYQLINNNDINAYIGFSAEL